MRDRAGVGREAELLAHLDRTESDAPRVLLGRGVLLGQGHKQCSHVQPEERLFLGDQLHRAKVADQRSRHAGAAIEVERHRAAEKRDPDELEAVAEPPAEVRLSRTREQGTSAVASHTIPTATSRSSSAASA